MGNNTDKDNVNFLISRLCKEVANSKGYIGVEYDNLSVEDGKTHTEALFHAILSEMNVLNGSGYEYAESWTEDKESPFKTEKNVQQHIRRLEKFVKKYANNYLSEEKALGFIHEAEGY